MRSFLIALAGLILFAGHAAQAKVDITVDQSAQMMTVAVDGVPRYHWPVSTGIPSRATPDGSFRAFRMEASHFSKEFDDAPMPHSIFFTKVGHAIHGTDSEGRLGTPASHGCVRLSKANAATLYALVQQQGVLNTSVTLTGSAAIALARNPRRANTAVAQREPATQPYQEQEQYPDQQQYAGQQQYPGQQQYFGQQQYPAQQQYATTGEPMQLTPQPQLYPSRRVMPQQRPQERPDDGYIYPADGSSDDQRYPAPRGMNRPQYNAEAYQQRQYQQQQYYNNNPGYVPPPPGYYQQQQYYQQRGYYQN